MISQKKDTHQLEELGKTLTIAAYNTGRIGKELSYMNRMNYFSGKYDSAGLFLQRPPM